MPQMHRRASHGGDVARRLTRLERANRLLIVAMLVGSAAVLTAARSDQADVWNLVQARTVQIVDEGGRVRMELTHDSAGTRLYVRDAGGDVRIGVAQFAHGGGGVALHGPGGKGAAVLYLRDGGSLTFFDSTGAVTARLPAP